ncbi:metal-dependent transcriptional regulator [Nafulsella turpanensis]|uniref:metal-dependent transcriptional regulator n=1 Tax=Nafulsella turpanensis TaxID=1265690 RepID=UPI00034708C9|nr:iron dependent repressor, metal binding and dimerization domain protein [Nafulsella turpanensis]
MLSFAEENYLKTIFQLSSNGKDTVSTNELAESMQNKPASASDMIKKLAAKELLEHVKYRGVHITETGKKEALKIIRKHRLWEVFLVEKLHFNWDEVDEVAEQLEHIKSPLLVERLDHFLGNPQYDPHGDPIPNAKGEYNLKPKLPLTELAVGSKATIVAVKDSSPLFLQYLDKIGAHIQSSLLLLDRIDYDGSVQIRINGGRELFISRDAAENLLVTEDEQEV